MRKTKIKLLNFALLLLLIYSCSNEHNFLSSHHHHGEKSNDISLKQFLKETNIKTFDTNLKIGKQDNALFRTAQITDFIVDTTSILKHIAENNKTTYSFKTNSVSNEFSNAKTYNLVYFKVNNTWENTVISFDQTDSDVNPNLKQITNIEQIYSSNLPTDNQIQRVCYQYTYSISCDGSCDGPCDGFACPTGQCIKMTISTISCGGGSDNVSIPDLGSSGATGGSSAILEFEPNPKGGSSSLVDNPNPTPCNQLKKIINTPSIVSAINFLKDYKLNEPVEFGYSISTFQNSTSLATPSVIVPNPNNPHAINIPSGNNIVGALHVHTNTGSLLFSPQDFRALAGIANTNNNDLDCSVFFVSLTTNDGTFNIMIDDFTTFLNAMKGENYLKFKKELEDEYIKEGLSSTSINFQKILLKAMSKHNIGASLYKANADLSGWNKLSLDAANPNNNPITTPCE